MLEKRSPECTAQLPLVDPLCFCVDGWEASSAGMLQGWLMSHTAGCPCHSLVVVERKMHGGIWCGDCDTLCVGVQSMLVVHVVPKDVACWVVLKVVAWVLCAWFGMLDYALPGFGLVCARKKNSWG